MKRLDEALVEARVIALFNPFHKSKGPGGGQFTTGKSGTAGVSNIDQGRWSREVKHISGKLSRNVSGMQKVGKVKYYTNDVVREYGLDAFYVPEENALVTSTTVSRLLAQGNSQARSLMIHELLHTRGGRNRFGADTPDNHDREEGLNSLMTAREYRRIYGERERTNWRNDHYRKQIRTTGGYFLKQAGGDPRKAWKMIDEAHLRGGAYGVRYSEMGKYASDEAVDQLMGAL